MLVHARNTSRSLYSCSDYTGTLKEVLPGGSLDVTDAQWESLQRVGSFQADYRYDLDPVERPFKERYIGYTSAVNEVTGYGRQGYQILQNMVRSGLHVTFHESPGYARPDMNCLDDQTRSVITRSDRANAEWTLIHSVVEPVATAPGRRKIAWSMWEADRLPGEHTETPFRNWTKIINEHAEVSIVPATVQKEIFLNSGVKTPVYVVHDAIDTDMWVRPQKRNRGERPLTVFVHGYMNKRKMPIETLNCFLSAFGPGNPNVRFIGKTVDGVWGAGRGGVPGFPSSWTNVRIINDVWSEDYLREFILNEVDIGFYLSHGEGYMDGPPELLALGKPTIVVDHSGPHDYVEATRGKGLGFFPVETKGMEPAPQAPEYMKWWLPDLDSAVSQLTYVVENYDRCAAEAEKGSQWVAKNLSQEHQRKLLMKVLQDVCV